MALLQLGMTPLHYAARDGHASVVAALLGKGAKVNAIDKVGHLMCKTLCVDAMGQEITTWICCFHCCGIQQTS